MALGPQLTLAQTEKSSALKISRVVQAGIIKLWNRPSCYFSSNCSLCCLVSRHFSINCCICADNTGLRELLLSFQWPPSPIVLAFWPGATRPCFQHPQPWSRAGIFPCSPARDSQLLQRAHYKPDTAHQLRIWPTLFTWRWSPVIWHFNNNKKKYLNTPLFTQSWSFLAISHRDPRPQIPQPCEPLPSPAGASQTSHTRVNLLQSISSCSPLHAASTC